MRTRDISRVAAVHLAATDHYGTPGGLAVRLMGGMYLNFHFLSEEDLQAFLEQAKDLITDPRVYTRTVTVWVARAWELTDEWKRANQGE